ncbi:MAG: hypothetical protein JJV95_04475 [Sulfurospirillum sp.]|nr:hypothetical protein [Sulfurospirillum sp.]
MSLLPNNSSLADQEFASLVEKIVTEDYQALKINPLSCDIRLLPHLAICKDVNIAGLTESEARTYINNSQDIKKYTGTVYAVEQSINVCFEDGKLKEWFDTDLEEGYFDIDVTLRADPTKLYDAKKFKKAKELINKAKNVRSHLGIFSLKVPNSNGQIKQSGGVIINLNLTNSLTFNTRAKIYIGGGTRCQIV